MLTDAKIRALKPRPKLYRVADSAGLCLEITPKGAKHWRYRYRWAGKARMIGMGSYPVVTLAKARELHLEARRQLANGQDPAQLKRDAKHALIEQEKGRFPVFAAAWMEDRRSKVRPRTFDKIEAIVTDDLIPALRHSNIATITTPEAMRALAPLIERAPHMAIKAVGYLNGMIDQAIKAGIRPDGRTLSLRGAVRLPRSKSVAAAIDEDGLKRVLTAIDAYENRIVRAALQLAALMALRPLNIVQARWDQIDRKKSVWTIPAEHMKTGEDHSLPLPKQARAILDRALEWADRSGYVFPTQARRTTQHLHRDTLSKALRDSGLRGEHVPHGFRASFRTIAREEFGVDVDVLEAQLAHSPGNATQRAYNRSKHLRERAEVMQRWADYLDRLRAQ